MNIVNRIAVATILFVSSSYAGDNSQATLGDIKEAVYKLIVQSKKTDNRIKTIEEDFNNVRNQKVDKLSTYIDSFVSSNQATLGSITH